MMMIMMMMMMMMMQDVVDSHPGLTFLQDAPEFHSRYVQTVNFCIFFYKLAYSIDRICLIIVVLLILFLFLFMLQALSIPCCQTTWISVCMYVCNVCMYVCVYVCIFVAK